ncbi:MAG: hypothetical protein HFJ60_03965 [Clostridia bacterium]|jgi:hypothetical protein|nr:hypothetical protein [Clostridia bacterium]
MSEFIRKEFLRFIYQFILNKKYSTAEKLMDFLINNENDINLVNWYLEFKKLLYERPLIICQRIREYLR